jgi:hypothetical protein
MLVKLTTFSHENRELLNWVSLWITFSTIEVTLLWMQLRGDHKRVKLKLSRTQTSPTYNYCPGIWLLRLRNANNILRQDGQCLAFNQTGHLSNTHPERHHYTICLVKIRSEWNVCLCLWLTVSINFCIFKARKKFSLPVILCVTSG